jgi:hypothetical protein
MTMAHILFECDVAGQKTVWALAEKLWRAAGREWPYM